MFHTGAGASPQADGWLTLTGMGSAGLCLLDSVELDELRFPIKVYKQAISINSEGAGRRRGSPGAHVEYGPFKSKIKVAYASCLLYTSPSPRDKRQSRMPSSA